MFIVRLLVIMFESCSITHDTCNCVIDYTKLDLLKYYFIITFTIIINFHPYISKKRINYRQLKYSNTPLFYS